MNERNDCDECFNRVIYKFTQSISKDTTDMNFLFRLNTIGKNVEVTRS